MISSVVERHPMLKDFEEKMIYTKNMKWLQNYLLTSQLAYKTWTKWSFFREVPWNWLEVYLQLGRVQWRTIAQKTLHTKQVASWRPGVLLEPLIFDYTNSIINKFDEIC